jgi:Fur family ferric uptake transcriptional regulator
METPRSSNYNTRQGGLLFEYFSSLGDRHVQVNEIAEYFRLRKETIGLTTIYRHLEKMVNAGLIRKYSLNEGESACYQYINHTKECGEHFHLKCENCGTLIHLECKSLEKIKRHILKKHQFRINTLKTVFYGQCKNCLEKDKL